MDKRYDSYYSVLLKNKIYYVMKKTIIMYAQLLVTNVESIKNNQLKVNQTLFFTSEIQFSKTYVYGIT